MNILIIGAKAVGLKAACRVKRLLSQASVTVIDRGEHISLAACGLPYFMSGDIEQLTELLTTPYDVVRTPEYFTSAKGIEVLTGVRADQIDPDKCIVSSTELATDQKLDFAYDKLVIATGASAVFPPIEGIDLPGVMSFKDAEDAIALKQGAAQSQIEKAAVIGGGFIGCEVAEAFGALWGIDTTLIEMEQRILSQMLDAEMAHIAELELSRQGVNLFCGARVNAIKKDGDKLRLELKNGDHLQGFDRVVVSAGVKPRVGLAEDAGVAIGSTGGIIVDAQMRTNIPNISAAGDCVQLTHVITGKPCYLPLGSLANRMGRTAANAIAEKDDVFAPVCGAACLKVYDMNVAAVGLTARAAEKAGFDVGESWGYFTDKADYYPEYQNLSVKLVYDRVSQAVLGVQAVSKGDAIRRIDATSTMIRQGVKLKDIRDFEPAYAPPYATALDPLHYLSYIAISTIEEGITAVSPLDFEKIAEDFVILDIREPIEVKEDPLTVSYLGLINIPFTELRSRLDAVPKKDPLLVVCAKGVRSAEAVRILQQNDCENVRYVGGGLLFFNK